MVATNQFISWPQSLPPAQNTLFEGTIGSIDGTNHLRTRVHPRQADWYRADKGRQLRILTCAGFNMLAQVVVGHDSRIYQVDLFQGHNNDKGAYLKSGLNLDLVGGNIKLLADGGAYNCYWSNILGYSHCQLVTPNKGTHDQSWNNRQKALRSVVETVIGLVKNWEAAHFVFRGRPATQAMALLICYSLTAQRLLEQPLR